MIFINRKFLWTSERSRSRDSFTKFLDLFKSFKEKKLSKFIFIIALHKCILRHVHYWGYSDKQEFRICCFVLKISCLVSGLLFQRQPGSHTYGLLPCLCG